jgi:hypothetical protein
MIRPPVGDCPYHPPLHPHITTFNASNVIRDNIYIYIYVCVCVRILVYCTHNICLINSWYINNNDNMFAKLFWDALLQIVNGFYEYTLPTSRRLRWWKVTVWCDNIYDSLTLNMHWIIWKIIGRTRVYIIIFIYIIFY